MTTDWQALEAKYYLQTVRRTPVTLVRGQGVRVWDDKGRQYLDFVGGWAADILGHCHPTLVKAIQEQAATLIHTSNQFYTAPQVELAQALVQNSDFSRVFFTNSGTEAVEGLIKTARRYGKAKKNGAYEMITAQNSFHGRTMGSISATGQPHYQEPFTPLLPGFVHVEFNSVEAIMAATTEKTVAVLLEPVQGEGGVIVPAPGYLAQVRRWCDERGLLLFLDEVQTGIGRLGTLFGYQNFDIVPDGIALAKGLGGGMPIGAFLVTEKANVLTFGDHGSTFGGNPLACAASLAVLRTVLEQDIPAHVQRAGGHLRQRLLELARRYPLVQEVRGMGLLWAVQFTREAGQQVLEACMARGLLVNRVRPNAVRLMPPLVLTEAEADEAVGILEASVAEAEKSTPRNNP
ncbi:MAG: acetylornithine transaminase [Chloroflexi bacterium]|nr:acetylornithine transaminase [Chloroflexota bacterium]